MLTSTMRKIMGTGRPALVVLFLFCLGGCGKVANVHHAAGYDALARDGAKYAVGGFVLDTRLELDRQAEIGTAAENSDPRYQTDTWAPLLAGPLLAGREGLDVWAWSALRDNIPADAIAAVQTAYARGSVLPPEMFMPVARDLPEVTYLVLARIESNDIEIGANTPTALGNQLANESRDPHAETDMMARSIKTRRTVGVSMDVYDLRTGRSVWRGSVTREKTELYSASDQDIGAELVVTPATEEGAAPEIEVKGASLAMPELSDVLDEACAALVAELFKEQE